MTDIDAYIEAIKINWVKRLTDETCANWKIIPTFYFREFGENNLIFKMNLNSHKSLENLKNLPTFYFEILKCWIKNGGGKTKVPDNYRDIRKQVIWGNQYIKTCGKSLYYSHWVKENIIFVNDVIDDKGEISHKILDKLKKKQNWIAELFSLRKALPKSWIQKLKGNISKHTKINITQDIKMFCNGLYYNLDKIKFKEIYNIIIRSNKELPTVATQEKTLKEYGSLYDADIPEIERWRQNSKDFIKTDIFTDILQIIKDNHCVLLTGVSGMGKTLTAQNIALQLCYEEGIR
ncbi:unnamed protein product [Mytilus edulis]|uniref:Novel STAND NTPase 3 domain-containing protein n=1 Tax=Mytilus edulis TaxID=6550 RepID=A0A8S3R6L5_MYTED|nr:unnamed protein product [Mytilus edulis]